MSRPATSRRGSNASYTADTSNQEDGRPMQVKVLYTFDENKTNCLTRCPQPLTVRTAFVDSSTQIGIVQFQTCVQTVVQASPELMVRTEQDYTVYAYDYSEFETPLVGQGMLSDVLSSSSQAMPTMVTGIVRKNLFGLFSGGVSETLEVKLRLVPVLCRQAVRHTAPPEKSRILQESGTDHMDISSFLQSNNAFGLQHQQDVSGQSCSGRLKISADVPDSSMSTFDEGLMQLCDGKISRPDSRTDDAFFNTLDLSSINQQAAATTYRPSSRNYSRPSSRTSVRGLQQMSETNLQPAPFHSRIAARSTEPTLEPARKRAQVTQTNWNGPSALELAAESLRVKASSAALMRGRRLSMHPTASELASGDMTLRPPTPRPHANLRNKRALPRSNTGLVQEVITHRNSNYSSPYAGQNDGSDGAITSPDAPSIASTPLDIPSSPPVLRHDSPAPSSPCLPALRMHADSGFVSGTLDECLDDNHDDEMRPLDDEDVQVLARYSQRPATAVPIMDESRKKIQPQELSIHVETPGDPNLLPRKILPLPPGYPRQPAVSKKRAAMEAPDSSPRLPGQRRGSKANRKSTAPPQSDIPMSDIGLPQLPLAYQVSFSDALSQDLPPEAMSGMDCTAKSNGSGLKRKRAIQTNLATCLATGAMPPYCKNCGEVNTPTWRKAFTKVEEGAPTALEEEDGGKAWEVLEKDEDGTVTSYRVFRKSVKREDKDKFEELQLCNPCGIWLWKNGGMRPSDLWNKPITRDTEGLKKRACRKKKTPSPAAEAPEIERLTDADSGLQPLSQACEIPDADQSSINEACRTGSMRRSTSLGPSQQTRDRLLHSTEVDAALTKTVQSSPPRTVGSKNSPINLDEEETPKPTRRLIFPSPRRFGEVKSLEYPSGTTQTDMASTERDATTDDTEDKENQKPPKDDDERDGLAHLFEGESEEHIPRTPKSGPASLNVFKTPTPGRGNRVLTPKGFLSSAARRWRDAAHSPNRSGSGGPDINALTPFTAELTRMLSHRSPSRRDDFNHHSMAMFADDLPSDADFFHFSDFSMDANAFSLDMSGLEHSFSLYEDPNEATGTSAELWSGGEHLSQELSESLLPVTTGEKEVKEEVGDGVEA